MILYDAFMFLNYLYIFVSIAAHGLYPGPGLGARMAFEDAHELTPLLHEAFSGQITLADAIKRYLGFSLTLV